MKEKVYNHFVPQFLMRNFSQNGKSIGLYIKKSQKYEKNASIRKICGSNYLYGKTSELEDLLCDLEGSWATSIKNVCCMEKLPFKKSEIKLLYALFTVSEERTLYMANIQEKFFNETIKNDICFLHNLNVKEYMDINPSNINIKTKTPNLIPIKCAIDMVESIYKELNLALIVNMTKISFLTSDCPIAKYNPLLINSYLGYGWKQKGILAFMPVSNKYMLALIDKKSYSIKSLNPKKIIIHDEKSINELNKLMFLQADNFILFNNSLEKEYLDKIAIKNLRDKRFDFSHFCITYWHIKSVKNKIELPFLKLKKGITTDNTFDNSFTV